MPAVTSKASAMPTLKPAATAVVTDRPRSGGSEAIASWNDDDPTRAFLAVSMSAADSPAPCRAFSIAPPEKPRVSAESTATPSAPPTMLDILNTPAAAPARSIGTSPTAVSEIGVDSIPSPIPTTSGPAASSHNVESAERKPRTASPAARTNNPMSTGTRPPRRFSSRAPCEMNTKMPTVDGSISRPASTAPYPRTFCSQSTSR